MKNQPSTCFNIETLLKRLTEQRKNLGFSGDEVVKLAKTGLIRSSLQAWESGKREPKIKYIYDLARIYGVQPEVLLGGEYLPVSEIPETTKSDIDDEYNYVSFYDIQASSGLELFTCGEAKPNKNWHSKKCGFNKKDCKLMSS